MRERAWKGDSISFDSDKADFSQARFIQANLAGVQLVYANLSGAMMVEANLDGAWLANANLSGAYLQNTSVRQAFLLNADLSGAQLSNVNLSETRLDHANLISARIQAVDLSGAWLVEARMDASTELRKPITLNSYTLLGDVRWGGVPLSHIEWSQLSITAEERAARSETNLSGKEKDAQMRRQGYEAAARVNRQLAAALRDQGINEAADHYAYRAQVLQREVFRYQGQHARWVFSHFLDGIAGYGYQPQKTLLWYGAVLVLSTLVYFWQARFLAPPPHLVHGVLVNAPQPVQDTLGESFVSAITALHGRGVFPAQLRGGMQYFMSAFDAVAGLIIEASFVATFVQRFFGR